MIKILIMLAIGAVGLMLLARGLYYILRLKKVRGWVPASAEIKAWQIERFEKPEVYAKIEYFKPAISYEYVVDGVGTENNVVSPDGKGWVLHDSRRIEELIEQILKEKVAYYNPDNHSESVLIKGVSRERRSHYYGLVSAGIILISVCISLLSALG